MNRIALLSIVCVGGFISIPMTRSAIPVSKTGTGILRFEVSPAATEWTTYSMPGAHQTYVSTGTLDGAVQQLSANWITNALPSVTQLPLPGMALAQWNSTEQLLESRPSGNAATVLMATLTNATSENISRLTLSYSLGEHSLGIFFPEAIGRYRVFHSTSGQPGSWQFNSTLSSATPGLVSATLELGVWNPGASLYLLWADDAAVTEFNPGASIDNVLIVPPRTNGIISVYAAGTGTNYFDTYPTTNDGWSTAALGGLAADITNAVQLDAAAQMLQAANLTLNLWQELSDPEIDGGNNRASYNFMTHTLQSRPIGTLGNPLLATLQNNTGSNISGLRISYRFALVSLQVFEEVPGFRAYYSFRGEPGTWQVIPEMCTPTNAIVNHVLELWEWRPGAPLYLLWMDDNGSRGTLINPPEGTYIIDDLSLTPVPLSPRLQLHHVSGFSWDFFWREEAVGFRLESTAQLPSLEWQDTPGSLETYGGLYRLHVFNATNRIFRLVRP